MNAFALASILITVAALLSVANHRLVRLPPAIGMTLLSLLLATGLLIAGKLAGAHSAAVAGHFIALVAGINFNHLVLHGMLAFLLFAGALGLDASQLSNQKWVVLALASVTTVASMLLIATLCRLVMPLLGLTFPLAGALLLGALLSPTDPVAALAILRRAGVSPALESQLSGEALFNDAVGAVLFVALLESSQGGKLPGFAGFTGLLLRQAGGGILLGIVLGLLVAALLRFTQAYRSEILLTLALAMGGYALADAIHVSAPLEAVVSGLVLGGRLHKAVFSEPAQEYVAKFWDLVDSIMNSLLFLLLGLELVVVPLHLPFLLAGLCAVPLVLLSRYASVVLVMLPRLGVCRKLGRMLTLMTWGGMRGAISVALALALPASQERGLLLTITYVVVVFSIVVQGLTIGRLAHHLETGVPQAELAS